MSDLNMVQLIGRLGAKPELRHTANGHAVLQMRVATSKKWKNKDGTDGEQTEWHTVVCWDKLAETCERYLDKGRQVYVMGTLQTREYEDKENIKRRSTEIVAQEVKFIGASPEHGSGQPAQQGGQRRGPPAQATVPGMHDDIPF